MRFTTSDGAVSSAKKAGAIQVIGFGCLQAWFNVVFFSRLVHYSTRNDISHLNSTYTFACCGIIAALLICALPWKKILGALGFPPSEHTGQAELWPSRRRCLVLGAVMTVCTVTLLLVERNWFRQPWCSIASTVAGLALGALYLGWARVFTDHRRDGRPLVAWIALGFVTGATLFVATLHLPEFAGMVVVCALPLASVACLWPLTTSGTRSERSASKPETGASLLPQTRPVLVRAMASFALLGLAESLTRALFMEVDPVSNGIAYRWLFLLATTAAAAIVVTANAVGARAETARTLNRVCLFTMVVLTALAPIVRGNGLLADLPAMVCFCLFYLFLWTSLAQTARAYRIEVAKVFGYGLGLAYAGCLAGTFLGSVLASFFAMEWRATCLVALLSMCIVLIALLFVADDRTLITFVGADDERPQGPRRFMLRIEEVAAAYGLSAKETEVLTLAAKGRTIQRIREELGVSTGTVNTHLMHIYKKLGVHDRQQMLDLLDGHGGQGDGR